MTKMIPKNKTIVNTNVISITYKFGVNLNGLLVLLCGTWYVIGLLGRLGCLVGCCGVGV